MTLDPRAFARRAGAMRAALPVVVCALLSPRPAAAVWPADPTFNVPLCTSTATSQVTSTVSDRRGGAIAVWYEDRLGDFGVYVRRVDSNGVARWTPDGTEVCTAPLGSAQILPKAVSDGAGGVILAWLDNRNGPTALFAQRIDSSGTRLWAAAGVQVATSATQVTTFDLAADGSNGVAVAWASQVLLSSNIFAQRLNGSGAPLWTAAGQTLCNALNDQSRPMITRTASGAFVIAWEDSRLGFRTELYGQSISILGSLQWGANGKLLAGSAENAINPRLVPTGPDECLLLWDADSVGVGDIRTQRLSITGAPLWPAAGLRLFPAGVSGLLGATSDGAGGAFAIVNAADPFTGKSPLWINRINLNGIAMMGPSGVRVSSYGSNQIGAVLTNDGGTGCVVAWFDDQGGAGTSFQLYAQHVAGNSVRRWYQSGIPVCSRPTQIPSMGIVLASNARDVVLAWSDTRAGAAADVYAQGVDSTGALGPLALGVNPGPGAAVTALARPSPNPAPHGRTTLSYTLSAREYVRLQVLDPAGRVVSVLEDGMREAGLHQVVWEGGSADRALPPGLYLVHLRTPSRNEIRRLVLL